MSVLPEPLSMDGHHDLWNSFDETMAVDLRSLSVANRQSIYEKIDGGGRNPVRVDCVSCYRLYAPPVPLHDSVRNMKESAAYLVEPDFINVIVLTEQSRHQVESNQLCICGNWVPVVQVGYVN